MELKKSEVIKSNLLVMDKVIGGENIKKYYQIELDKLNEKKKEKSLSTKMKRWFQ